MRTLALLLLTACGTAAPSPAHAEDTQTCDVTVKAPQVTVEPPQVTVQAPDVAVNPTINVPAPQVTVTPAPSGQIITVNIIRETGGDPWTTAGYQSIQWQTWVFTSGSHHGLENCAVLTANITDVSDPNTWEEDMTGCCPQGYTPIAVGPTEQGDNTYALVCQS